MKFHLDHIPADPGFRIRHSDQLFLTGSCFSQHIYQKLGLAGFKSELNPSGIQFNPQSIVTELLDIIQEVPVNSELFIERENHWYSFQAHSSLNAKTKEDLAILFSENRKAAYQQLKKSSALFITLGSAYYYKHLSLQTIVANCHKQPQQYFEKLLASPQEITESLGTMLQIVAEKLPNVKVVFTVSPVRHLRDGLVENTLSKSTLHLAIHQVLKLFPEHSYFPAFELISEDLKDYRFYEADLMHPNAQAIEYVWEKFKLSFFEKTSLELANLYEALNKAKAHRPIHENPAQQKKFEAYVTELTAQINLLQKHK